MLLAQISDFHVVVAGTDFDVRFGSAASLERAVSHLSALSPRPDAVVCSGDLVDGGTVEEYARLREILDRLPVPYYLAVGNHDDRAALRAVFADHAYLPSSGFCQYAVDVGSVRLVVLDTQIPGAPGGRLCDERLGWLEAELAAARDRPTIVVQHHPPFATGITAMDAMGLDGAAEELAILARHPQVERVVCGHLHRSITARVGGTMATTCPSTTWQVALDLRQPGGLGLVPEPPACLLHRWSADAGLVTHVSYVDAFTPRIDVHV